MQQNIEIQLTTGFAFFGMGVFSKSEIRWGESFMYEGVVGTRGLIMWSRKAGGAIATTDNRSNSMRCLV